LFQFGKPSGGRLVAKGAVSSPEVLVIEPAGQRRGAIARLVAAGEDGGQVEVFEACLEDLGRSVPLAIASTLVGMDWSGGRIEPALTSLADHRSAAVREAAREALRG